MKEANLGAN